MLGGTAPAENIGQLSRMDLGQKQVEELLPFLEYFARTGKLPAPETHAGSTVSGISGVDSSRRITVAFPGSMSQAGTHGPPV